ncbi:MAG: protease HtpX, partial [Burkholderiales bacterium]|nr:protease HtpX [Burkholderiales bacterium]
MKRIFLLIATNVAVMVVLSFVCTLLGVDKYLTQASGGQFNMAGMLIVSAVFGFGGAFISLLLSKFMAKRSTGAHVITAPANETEAWLVQTVERLANRANIKMPEVAIYEGSPNAFATGARRDAALVAVSTGLLQSMNKSEVEAVLGHEIAHVANGDMVTLTLVQGVVNTFVFFLARVVGTLVDRVLLKNEGRGDGIGYFATVMIAQVVLGVLASIIVAFVSRAREFRADAGSAEYLGQPTSMINALKRLGGLETEPLPESLKAFGIAGGKLSMLFSSHPPIEKRIEA